MPPRSAATLPRSTSPATRPVPRTPQELARARAATRRRALTARAEAAAARKAAARARRRAALTRWTHRAGAVTSVLLVVLVGAVVVSGVQPATPAAASAPLDLAAQAAQLRDQLTATTTDLQAARAGVTAAITDLTTAQADLATAQAALAAARAAVGSGAGDLYRGTPADRAVAAGFPAGTDLAVAGSVAVLAERADQRLAGLTRTAQDAQRSLEHAQRRVTAAQAVLDAAHGRITDVTDAARARAEQVPPVVTAALAGLPAAPTSADQQATADAARTAWQARLGALAAAGITLPTAAQLRDGDLPGGLSPARDAAGAPVPGAAVGVVDGAVVPVPSAEAAAAVSFAFAQLGTPYSPGGSTAAGMDCGGLTAAVWTSAGTALGTGLVDQWSAGTVVPTGQLQAGDLVFGIDPLLGLDDVGVYVGDGQVVTASARQAQVIVAGLPEGATAVRTSLPVDAPNAAPPGTGSLVATCGALPTAATVAGAPVDPAWGGWSNGRIPVSVLCPVGGGQLLRCDAAAAYTALDRAFQQAFGTPLCITDSYRSYAAQLDAHTRKPRITAVPGTSNHGWGLAVDLCGGVNVFGTPQHDWMVTYAGHLGWVHPDWAQATGSNPEPWHWEFGHLAD
ncbi:NlpC/P60 family protein [Klenkia brasiliensis]|uniref:Cell wall-associated hydrolase, NlpC family n=1 Tax=Klenkia brasiliensis TaxID=333142 RepID=A0A1G7LH74_9ACTN|nr:NlpC/P60 family protein [Klenkia brasiliensis]SDF48877.1 Cell wall-associated hydrolase, NlpC family [Klenkia brasiliensis]